MLSGGGKDLAGRRTFGVATGSGAAGLPLDEMASSPMWENGVPPQEVSSSLYERGVLATPRGGVSAIIMPEGDLGGELMERRGGGHSPGREGSMRRGRGGASVGLRRPPKTVSISRSNDSSEGGNPPSSRPEMYAHHTLGRRG
jgi:hypothetical protein